MHGNRIDTKPVFWSVASNNHSEQYFTVPAAVAGLLHSRGQNIIWFDADFIEQLQKSQAHSLRSAYDQADKIAQLFKHAPERCVQSLSALADILTDKKQPENQAQPIILFNHGNSLSSRTLAHFLASESRLYIADIDPLSLQQTTLFLNACFFRLIELEFPKEYPEWLQAAPKIDRANPLPDILQYQFFDADRLARIYQRTRELVIHLVLLHGPERAADPGMVNRFDNIRQQLFPALTVHGPWHIDPICLNWFQILDTLYNQTSRQESLNIWQEIDERCRQLQSRTSPDSFSANSNHGHPFTVLHNQVVLNLQQDDLPEQKR